MIAEKLGCICPNCGAPLPVVRTFATAKIIAGMAPVETVGCRKCGARVRVAGGYFGQNARAGAFGLPFLALSFAAEEFFNVPFMFATVLFATIISTGLLIVRLNGLEVVQ